MMKMNVSKICLPAGFTKVRAEKLGLVFSSQGFSRLELPQFAACPFEEALLHW